MVSYQLNRWEVGNNQQIPPNVGRGKMEEKMNIPESIMKKIGTKVTTISKYNGVGLGYVLPADFIKDPEAAAKIAFISGGNGFYYPRDFVRIIKDGGRKYMERVTNIEVK